VPRAIHRGRPSDRPLSARAYAAAVRRVLPRAGASPRAWVGRAEERLVFVVGCPRSGTTFLAGAIGSVPGFVDLGEVHPLKAAIPDLTELPDPEAARRLRRVLETVRRLGLVAGLRGVEQTPEVSFVLPAALAAYPRARVVHIVRDGRDVVSSLLERGWLGAGRGGRDDARQAYGAHARFWVEPERRDEFERTNEARRAAWAWRRYVGAARVAVKGTLELRFESLVADPAAAAEALAEHLDAPAPSLAAALAAASAGPVGRHRTDLTPDQLADVDREAGPLLRELGYR
jgi:Sulfotransferase family